MQSKLPFCLPRQILVILVMMLTAQLSFAGPFDPAHDPERGWDDSRFQTSYEYAKRLRGIELDIEELKLLEFMQGAEWYIDDVGCRDHVTALTELNNESNQLDEASYQKMRLTLAKRRQQIKGEYEQCFNGVLQSRWFTHLNPYGIQTWGAFLTRKNAIKSKIGNVEAKIKEDEEKHARARHEGDYKIIAIMTSVTHDVSVLTEFGWEKAKKGFGLISQEEVRTGPKSRAIIEFLDVDPDSNASPTKINMGENSHVVIEKLWFDFSGGLEKPERYGVVNLIEGTIRSIAEKYLEASNSAMMARSGNSLCGIRGTEIEIDYHPKQDPDRVRYRLFHGDAFVETPTGQVPLKPGYETVVTHGQLSTPIPLPPEDRIPQDNRLPA